MDDQCYANNAGANYIVDDKDDSDSWLQTFGCLSGQTEKNKNKSVFF